MKIINACVAIAVIAAATADAASLDLTKWKYSSAITFETGEEKYVALDLTGQVYDAAKPDLCDIRIVDAGGQQVPYLLDQPHDITEKQKYTPTVIDRSTDDRGASLATLDFGRQVMKNFIEVETGGTNFRRLVRVEGSNDNITFFTLVKEAFVFAVDNRQNSRFSGIDLPANDYRYLRIAVETMPGEQQSPVIEEIRTFECEKKLARRIPVEMALTNHAEDEKNKSSVYEYDLNFRNLPISEILLSIADESFYRHVTVEGRNAATRQVKLDSEDNRPRFREVEESWNHIAGDTLYRYTAAQGSTRERTTISLPSGKPAYRYLKITIRNYDDRPLNIKKASAEMMPHRVIFEAAENLKASLYVGSESAVKPQYDITRQISEPTSISTVAAVLGPIAENPLFGKADAKPLPWTERHKLPLLIILAAVVLTLAGFILKSIKAIHTGDSSNQDLT